MEGGNTNEPHDSVLRVLKKITGELRPFWQKGL
jgi:hypothetical protein